MAAAPAVLVATNDLRASRSPAPWRLAPADRVETLIKALRPVRLAPLIQSMPWRVGIE
jgi:hypothetical protein